MDISLTSAISYYMHMCISPLLPCSLSFFLLLLIRLCLCKFFQIMIPYYCFASFLRYLICQQIHYYFSLFLLSYDLFLKYDCHLYFALDDYVDFFLDMLMLCSTRNIITISFSWFYFDSTDAILLFNILLCCCQRISYFCCC